MNSRLSLIILLLITLFASSCSKDQERIDDYLVEFATTINESGSYRFLLDNGKVLIPEKVEDFTESSGQRVILNYTPLEGNNIKINQIIPIFTGAIQNEGYPNQYSPQPVKLRSVWVGGNHLNLIIEVEYHSQPHSISLLRDIESSTVDLYLSYSRNSDQPGYTQVMYASFLLESLRTESESPIPFNFFINTAAGERKIQLLY